MAIYEYSCQNCGTGFEARRSMKDADAPIACPQCGKLKTKTRTFNVFLQQ